jgi:SM-20-related protein
MVIDSFNKVPPHGLVHNFFGAEAIGRLLAYAESNEHLFEDSGIGQGQKSRIDRTRRLSKRIGLGYLKREIKAKVSSLLPEMFEGLGSKPFIPDKLELELVVHGDGAFFARHLDTATGHNHLRSHRIISAVYYFYTLPKAFSGGVLRLHSLAASGQKGTFVDITPQYDTIVFFPSMFPHEVLPVRCPSGKFLESRFAINCWAHRN